MPYIFIILLFISFSGYAQLPVEWQPIYRQLSEKKSGQSILSSIDSIQHLNISQEYYAQIALGITYTELGDFNKAHQYFNRAAASLKGDSNAFMMASLCHNRAILYKRQSNYISAQQYLEQAKQYINSFTSPSCSLTAIFWNDYGVVAKRLGQNEQALYYFQKSLQEKEYCKELHLNSYYITLNNMAGTYMAIDQFHQADSLYQYVYQEKVKTLGPTNSSTLIAQHNLAVLYKQQERYTDAAILLKEVLISKSKNPTSTTYANSLYSLADILLLSDKTDSAFICTQQVIDIRTSLLGKEDRSTLQAMILLAEVYLKQKKYKEALHLYDHVLDVKWKEINDYYDYLQEEEKLEYIRKNLGFWNSYTQAVKTITKEEPTSNNGLHPLTEKWLQYRHAITGLALRKTKEQQAATCPEAKTLNDSLNQLRSLFAQDLLLERTDSNDLRKEQIRNIEQQLANLCPTKVSNNWNKNLYPKGLHTGDAYVEIVKESSDPQAQYYAYIYISKTKQSFWIPIGETSVLEKKAYAYYSNCIKFEKKDIHSFQNYWQAIHSILIQYKCSQVFLVRDGIYHFLSPLSWLNDAENKYTLRVLADKDVTIQPTRINKDLSALLMYAPTFEKDGESLFPALEGSKLEGDYIQKLLLQHHWRVTSYTDTLATEEIAKSNNSYRIRHYSTHGFYQPAGSDKYSYVEAMVASGLVWSDVSLNDTEEDGYLTAYELSRCQWQETDVVILSACMSGLGELSDMEGVHGLVRALRISGVKNTLVSLWKVDDAATQYWMETFYSFLVKGYAYRDAYLRTLEVVRLKYPYPKYWAAFVWVEN
ncbi:MAG: CHAT domain-containing tetratricopeptide repeat protein [Cytophagaceae bacterium]